MSHYKPSQCAWAQFLVIIVFHSAVTLAKPNDQILQNCGAPPGMDVFQHAGSMQAIENRWQERLSLAEARQGKKDKYRGTHFLENALFPALAVMVITGWYFGGQLPILNGIVPQTRGFYLVNAATTIVTVYPWVLRDARRWLSEEEGGRRTQWLPAYSIFWGIQAGVWLAIHGSYGNSLVWSQLAGYTFLELLYQSGDIADDDNTLLFTMLLVSAVVADIFYFLTYPHAVSTHVAHAIGHLNGAALYYLLNRVGSGNNAADAPIEE